jgi:IS30 family transposase
MPDRGHVTDVEVDNRRSLHAGSRSQNEIASALDRAPSTISRELRRNSRPTKAWMGLRACPGPAIGERRRRWEGRFKLARQPDLRNCGSKSLAMGHSPVQIAGRLALKHVASSSAMSQSIVSSIIVRPRRIPGIACCRATNEDEGADDTQDAVPTAIGGRQNAGAH